MLVLNSIHSPCICLVFIISSTQLITLLIAISLFLAGSLGIFLTSYSCPHYIFHLFGHLFDCNGKNEIWNLKVQPLEDAQPWTSNSGPSSQLPPWVVRKMRNSYAYAKLEHNNKSKNDSHYCRFYKTHAFSLSISFIGFHEVIWAINKDN